MRNVSWCGLILLLLVIAGCKEKQSDRDIRTEVSCSSESVCDQFNLECTSTFDETLTTYIDEFGADYGDDFERFVTLEDRTQTIRRDDIDDEFVILASFQEEHFTATTIEEEIWYDHFGDEDRTITEEQTVTLTSWAQDCPTCPVTVCISNAPEHPFCFTQTDFPEFPVCDA